jgi:hypothetical protein
MTPGESRPRTSSIRESRSPSAASVSLESEALLTWAEFIEFGNTSSDCHGVESHRHTRGIACIGPGRAYCHFYCLHLFRVRAAFPPVVRRDGGAPCHFRPNGVRVDCSTCGSCAAACAPAPDLTETRATEIQGLNEIDNPLNGAGVARLQSRAQLAWQMPKLPYATHFSLGQLKEKRATALQNPRLAPWANSLRSRRCPATLPAN